MTTDVGVSIRRLTAEQRRQQLVAVALELFARRGYRATTMDDIAEAAGVTKPLVYQHFSSKRALYLELVTSIAHELLLAVRAAVELAEGPRQQVEMGFAAYFGLVISREAEFRLLYGRDHADDEELGRALRTVEDAMAEAIEPLIDAGLDDDHRRLLAYAVVGMAEGASRQFIEQRTTEHSLVEDEASRLAQRVADLAWAGLRSVHAD
jgi:AcrR family transcriptional regulator